MDFIATDVISALLESRVIFISIKSAFPGRYEMNFLPIVWYSRISLLSDFCERSVQGVAVGVSPWIIGE